MTDILISSVRASILYVSITPNVTDKNPGRLPEKSEGGGRGEFNEDLIQLRRVNNFRKDYIDDFANSARLFQ